MNAGAIEWNKRMGADTDHPNWRSGPDRPEPEPDAAHVWLVSTDQSADVVNSLLDDLDADERTRASRFRAPAARERYVVARACLRRLLGSYLGVAPTEIELEYGPHGKPQVRLDSSAPELQFNLTHSGDLALVAVAVDRRIGVDIERRRDRIDLEGIAKRFFAPEESAALMQLPDSERMRAFGQCWTRKEAYIKAWGEGLSHPLDAFVVSFGADDPPRIVSTRPDPREADRWDVHDVPIPDPDYTAAVVVERPSGILHCWRYPVV
ncbi:MAG: 4'-phosphopantetheinyl transferase superfamily protein [bacterium]|nr:4'-phosphopantetheinyl transferase superfamily protein [bacterium]